MNLSPILNMPACSASANPASAVVGQAESLVEMASFQDFLSLMGLSPMAEGGMLDLPEGDAAPADPALLAAISGSETGNLLPPALPVLPEAATAPGDPALLMQLAGAFAPAAMPAPTAGQVTREQPRSAPTTPQALPTQAAPAAVANLAQPQAQTLPPGVLDAIMAEAEQPHGARSAATLAPASVSFDLALSAAAPASAQPQSQPQPQVVAQPVLAQLLQAAPRAAQRKGGDEGAVAATATTAASAAADLPDEGLRSATAAPVLPVAASSALAAPQPDLASAQQGQSGASAPAAATTGERHDFTAVIDKLAEARELARPGRADMHVAHREFGQVSVQFELAGQALKVAMTSADPGFAPAVQAALADRPVAPAADAARADSQPQRGDNVSAATGSWQAGPQADGQRQDGQNRAQQARTGNGPVRSNDAEADGSRGHAVDRDGSRFA